MYVCKHFGIVNIKKERYVVNMQVFVPNCNSRIQISVKLAVSRLQRVGIQTVWIQFLAELKLLLFYTGSLLVVGLTRSPTQLFLPFFGVHG